MGFFSDLMKNPLMQMVMPMALSYMMPGIGSMIGTSAIANPMMRSAAEQAMLGYGTAALSGSKHPEKAAMYAGLGSMPFSFMKANTAANAYNQDMTNLDRDIFKTERFQTNPFQAREAEKVFAGPHGGYSTLPAVKPAYDYRIPQENIGAVDKFLAQQKLLQEEPLTAWDVLRGKDKRMVDIPERRIANVMKNVERPDVRNPQTQALETQTIPRSDWRYDDLVQDPLVPADTMGMPEIDFYSKVGQGQTNLLGTELKEGKRYADYLPTIASQSAGLYGGRMTDEEEWEATKARRRKELAFMYGVPEDVLGGEMENPYYGGGGFWKNGGIATLEMDAGGAVNGPGGPKDDVIDAKLSDGEFVMTAKAVENLGGGNRLAGAQKMYQMMNQLDPQSETVQESIIGV